MARITGERSVWQGVVVYLSVSLVSALTAVGTTSPDEISGELGAFFPQESLALLLRSTPVLSLISIFVFAPLLLFAWSAILHFSAELLGGRARAVQLATAVGYAQLPYILVAPLSLLGRYMQADIVGLAGFAAFIWSVYLKIEAIRALYSFGRGRAALAYFLPVILTTGSILVFFLLASTFLMPLLMELFPL